MSVERKVYVNAGRFTADAATLLIEEAAAAVEGKAVTNAPTNSGTLRNSIGRRKISDKEAEVYADAEYAVYVEFGTRPHFPPLAPIRDWARRVLGDESAAFPIARKIAREGTEAQPYMRPSLDEFKSQVTAFWRRALRKAYARNKR